LSLAVLEKVYDSNFMLSTLPSAWTGVSIYGIRLLAVILISLISTLHKLLTVTYYLLTIYIHDLHSLSTSTTRNIMTPSTLSTILLFLSAAAAMPAPTTPHFLARAPNSTCAPGGKFDLSMFSLQLPTGSKGKVDSVSAAKLKGCDGYQNEEYFFSSDSGSLIMKVPGSSESSGCVTTPNSKHCRTELRESNPSSWDSSGAVNRLKASLIVKTADDSKYGTVIGQVKVDDSVSKKPVAELFINKSGTLTIGVSQIPDKSSLKMTEIGKVTIGEKFEYELRYENGELSIAINGGELRKMSTGQLKSPPCYFKAGNYNQGDSPSEVEFFSIEVQHS
jgi:hypothetical protein